MSEVKQTKNSAFITGVLKEKKFETKIFDGKEMIMGTLVVLVEDEFGTGEIKVNFSQNALTKTGTENTLYKSLVTINQTYKSVVEVGMENADYIRITGDLNDSVFYAVDKATFVEGCRIRGTFVNRVNKEENPSGCRASVEGYVAETKMLENGEVEVVLIGIGYNGQAQRFTGVIPQDLAQAFMSMYQVGAVATLNFAIVNSVVVEEVQKTVGFGKALGEKITRTTTKRVIFGGEAPQYDAMTKEDVQKAMALREAYKEKQKQKSLDKVNGASKGASVSQGGFTQPQGGFTQPQGGFNTGIATGGFNTGGFTIQ